MGSYLADGRGRFHLDGQEKSPLHCSFILDGMPTHGQRQNMTSMEIIQTVMSVENGSFS